MEAKNFIPILHSRKQKDEAHCPRCFIAETDGDTWGKSLGTCESDEQPLEYWVERERVWKLGEIQEWKDVDSIFVEEPEEVSNYKRMYIQVRIFAFFYLFFSLSLLFFFSTS